MNFEHYNFARQLTEIIGQPLSYIIIGLIFVLIISITVDRFKNHTEKIAKIISVSLLGAFLVLVFFHIQIYTSVSFTNIITMTNTRLAVPLWIENEKLFFWSLLSFYFVYFSFGVPSGFRKVTLVLAGLFVAAVLIFNSPFSKPLPNLHTELLSLKNAITDPSSAEAFTSLRKISGRAVYYYNTTYMWIHPPLLFISYATFAISFIGCIFMLQTKEQVFDIVAYNFGKFGWLLLTVGNLLGYPWAIIAWKDEPWWWDPKINMSLMTWLFYSAYLHSRIYLQRKNMWTLTAWLGIISFAVLILTYLTSYLVPGVHSYG